MDRYKDLIQVKRKVGMWIEFYNKYRLHSSIQYMPPEVWHLGDPQALAKERKMKLEEAKNIRYYENLKIAS